MLAFFTGAPQFHFQKENRQALPKQPIRATVPGNPVTKKGRDWLLGGFLFGTEIGGY